MLSTFIIIFLVILPFSQRGVCLVSKVHIFLKKYKPFFLCVLQYWPILQLDTGACVPYLVHIAVKVLAFNYPSSLLS